MGLFMSRVCYFSILGLFSPFNQEDLRAKTLSKTWRYREKSVFLSVISLFLRNSSERKDCRVKLVGDCTIIEFLKER